MDPGDADERGFGTRVREEIETMVNRVLESDPWFERHPARWEWITDYPPYESADIGDLMSNLEIAAKKVNIEVPRTGLDSWHDAASLGLFGQTPAISFGPGAPQRAHSADEYVMIDELIRATKTYVSFLIRWCGTVETEGDESR